MATKDEVYEAIGTVIDPEVGFDLVSLGLIYDVDVKGDHVDVKMTLSTRGCPLHEMMVQWVKDAVLKLSDVNSVDVEIVWEPAWNISMASDEVKAKLGGGM